MSLPLFPAPAESPPASGAPVRAGRAGAAAAVRSGPGAARPGAARAKARPVPAPEALHPSLWLGHQLARQADLPVSSGFPALDDQLPGRGWPRHVLTELLLPHAGIGEVRLLAPSLCACQAADRPVMLFDPPAALSAWGLMQLGFDVDHLLIVRTRARGIPGSDSLWALEQSLKSGQVGAVLAWLPPRLRAERLRRLQLAAHAHDGPAFVLRELRAADRPTAAPLRLELRPAGLDRLQLRLLKRRGPPLESALKLVLPPVLPVARHAAASKTGGAVPPVVPLLHEATFIDLDAGR